MGWVKCHDLRLPVNPVMSWLSHPANRPRKVKGIHPCLLNANILATFSDAVADTVKVWDLRQIEGKQNHNKKGNVAFPKGFSVNPYLTNFDENNNNFMTSASIADISWSSTRADVLAVATTSSRSVMFFKCDLANGESSSPETSAPISLLATQDIVRCLSWQLPNRKEFNVSRPSVIDFFNVEREKNQTLVGNGSSTDSCWESIPIEVIAAVKAKQVEEISSRSATKRLLVLGKDVVSDSLVRESIPFSFCEHTAIIRSLSGMMTLDLTNTASIKDSEVPYKLLGYLNDIHSVMKDRCLAGYSFDASSNLDLFIEELDACYKIVDGSTAEQSFDQKSAEFYQLTASISELQRLWTWIDRLETSVNSTRLSLDNCGSLTLLLTNSTVTSDSIVDPTTGGVIFSSEVRSLVKRLSGWLNLAVTDFDGSYGDQNKSLKGQVGEETSVGSSDFEAENKDLLEILADDCCQSSGYERASVVSLWHGDIDLAVQLLHDALDNSSSCSENPDISECSVEPTTSLHYRLYDEDYLQTIALVASCIAGYSKSSDHVLSRYPNTLGWNVTGSAGYKGFGNPPYVKQSRDDRSSWKSMCLFTLNRLKKFRRPAASYLKAGCQFLLCNTEDEKDEDTLTLYKSVLEDEFITFEDKLGFAASYLNDYDFQKWMSEAMLRCKSDGLLDGLILTGLSSDGLQILQNYLDKTCDIQTVALITSRVLTSFSVSPSMEAESPFLIDLSQKWVYTYRELLNHWEMFTERAQLDIEISQKITKNKESRVQFPNRTSSSQLNLSMHGNNPIVAGNHSKMKISTNHLSGKVSQSVAMPVYEGIFPQRTKEGNDMFRFYYIKMKCGFCGFSLPCDDFPAKNMDALRTQKQILNYCPNCSKQLPRCYLCQLYLVSTINFELTLVLIVF
jgi:hypothetical protein